MHRTEETHDILPNVRIALAAVYRSFTIFDQFSGGLLREINSITQFM
jgi:hypothetical protein